MISTAQIQRMVQTGAFSRLVERILANGRCQSDPARRRLAEPSAAAAAGIGLALQRLCELTYGPSEAAAGLAERLLGLQGPDGLFGSGPDASIAASAVALRGLLDWRRQREDARAAPDHRLAGAIRRGMDALVASVARRRVAPLDRVDLEVVLWQLGRIRAFRRAVPVVELAPSPAASNGRGRGDDLTRFATAAAA
jgi:hypothetical protein